MRQVHGFLFALVVSCGPFWQSPDVIHLHLFSWYNGRFIGVLVSHSVVVKGYYMVDKQGANMEYGSFVLMMWQGRTLKGSQYELLRFYEHYDGLKMGIKFLFTGHYTGHWTNIMSGNIPLMYVFSLSCRRCLAANSSRSKLPDILLLLTFNGALSANKRNSIRIFNIWSSASASLAVSSWKWSWIKYNWRP